MGRWRWRGGIWGRDVEEAGEGDGVGERKNEGGDKGGDSNEERQIRGARGKRWRWRLMIRRRDGDEIGEGGDRKWRGAGDGARNR